MKTDNLHFDAQDKLYSGILKVSRAVGTTMGTSGKNAIIEAIENPGHIMTNDGYSIANAIVLADPIEDMGRKILMESINRANKASGDGSSTTCVLTAAILAEGRSASSTHNAMDIKRTMEACIPLIEESISAQKRIIDEQEVEAVATISAEDQDIGARIAEIYKQIGKSGIIYWDISKTSSDSYTIGKGITVEGATYMSPYMCDATETGQSTNQIRIKNPKILLTKQKVATASDFNTIGAALDGKDIKDLVVFADDVDPLVVPDLVKTRMVRGFRIIIIKMPTLWKDWWYEDLAKATGAKIIDPSAGLPMREATLEHLGTVDNIVVTKEDTHLDGIIDVSEHIAQLEAEDTDDTRLRAARLNTKTARYYVGAQSDSALSYRRLKVEDAISAAYQALNGGIVAGGGVALLNVARELPNTTGGNILRTALEAPFRQIVRNAGEDESNTLEMAQRISSTTGFNTKTKQFVDMFGAGVVDPANVVLNACKNAISVAATVLTAPTIVTLPREDYDPNPLEVIKR